MFNAGVSFQSLRHDASKRPRPRGLRYRLLLRRRVVCRLLHLVVLLDRTEPEPRCDRHDTRTASSEACRQREVSRELEVSATVARHCAGDVPSPTIGSAIIMVIIAPTKISGPVEPGKSACSAWFTHQRGRWRMRMRVWYIPSVTTRMNCASTGSSEKAEKTALLGRSVFRVLPGRRSGYVPHGPKCELGVGCGWR